MKSLIILALCISSTVLAKDKESPTPSPEKLVCVEKKEVKPGKSGDTPKTETKGTECQPAKDKPTSPEKPSKGSKNH